MPEILLPWPSTKLSPNSRVHYHALARAKKKYMNDCYMTARAANAPVPVSKRGDGSISLAITFHPPSGRKHDADNCVARAKSGLDGLAQYWKIDDSKFVLFPLVGEKVKGGCVRIVY
jgi:crossover junction endodeoxyribonuclease RusA